MKSNNKLIPVSIFFVGSNSVPSCNMEINKLKVIIYPKVETAFKITIFYYYINKMKNTFTRTRILEFVFYNFNDIELIYNVISNLNHN